MWCIVGFLVGSIGFIVISKLWDYLRDLDDFEYFDDD